MNEIKKFNEFRKDEDGIFYYYDNETNEDLWSYDLDLLADYITNSQDEIERLNNIINELEKYINDNYFYDDVGMKIFDVSLLEDKLKELKESDNNE